MRILLKGFVANGIDEPSRMAVLVENDSIAAVEKDIYGSSAADMVCKFKDEIIAPGFIETDILNAMTDKAKKEMTTPIPAKRLGQPEEVAEAVAFFANPANAYIE